MFLEVKKVCIITKYSHFFKINQASTTLVPLIYRFCLKYAIKNLVYERGRKPQFKVTNVFGIRIKDSVEFRFHIGQLAPFLKYLEDNYVSIDQLEIRSEPMYEPVKIDVKLREGWILKDYQEEVKTFIIADDLSDNHSRLVTMGTGTGKAQPLHSLIKVPGGWKEMGYMKVGNTVITKQGTHSKVVGVFPQGTKPVYRLTFYDGRTTECCLDHLWKIYNSKWLEPEILTLKEILDIGSLYRNKLYIDLVDPEDSPDAELHEDPYIYGAKVYKQGIILDDYINGSVKQKRALLQGMFHCSAVINEYGNIKYETKSQPLQLDLQYLVRSLGGIAKSSHNDENDSYTLLIKFKEAHTFLGKDERANEILSLSEHSDTLKLRLMKIDYIRDEETQCISIDHPDSLYVTDDFIVTHNTVSALATAADIKSRVAIVLLPAYLDKWTKDITECLTVNPKEVMVIQGGDSLKSLINLAKDNEYNSKFILFSLITLQNYYKAYENLYNELDNEGYNCHPDELFKLLGIGTVIIDEIHQHLHSVYRTLTYTHVPKVIGLSATFISSDPVVEVIQRLMFPKELRYDKVKMKKYIKAFAISYNFRDLGNSKIRTTEFNSTNYSHNAFEKSILKHIPTLNNYLSLIKDLVIGAYVKDYQKGDKLMIFASTIKLCTKIVEYLKKEFPKYDIRRYVESDPYENVIDADIRVSTVLSAGTALDIPNLRAVIQTDSKLSPVSNLQSIGRLRELKDRDVKYFYIYSLDIPKQVLYHKKRLEQINDRIISLNELHSNIKV